MQSRQMMTMTAFGWMIAGLAGSVLAPGAARAQDTSAQEASAQATLDKPAIRLGFHRGELFPVGPRRTRLEGFEMGADVPLGYGKGDAFGVFFSPTLTLGGSNRKGADEDGNIYRFLVNAKTRLGHSSGYVGLGAGYSFTQARVHEFRNVNGPASEFILGYDFHASRPSRAQPFVEATYHAGAHSQMSGISADFGLRL